MDQDDQVLARLLSDMILHDFILFYMILFCFILFYIDLCCFMLFYVVSSLGCKLSRINRSPRSEPRLDNLRLKAWHGYPHKRVCPQMGYIP